MTKSALRSDTDGPLSVLSDVTKADGEVIRRSEIDPGVDYVPPSGPLETRLAEMWQSILGIDMVGRLDSFFELGGDSLQAVEFFIAVEPEFGIRLQSATIIGHPTFAQLAALIGSEQPQPAECLVALKPKGTTPPLFLIHDGSGMLFSYRGLVRRITTDRRIYGLQYPVSGNDPTEVPPISELADSYVDVITREQPKGPYLLAGYSYGGYVAYEMAVLLRQRGREVGLMVLIDSRLEHECLTGIRLVARKLARHLVIMSDLKVSQWPGHVLSAICRDIGRARGRHRTQYDPPPAPQGVPPLAHKLNALFRASHKGYRPPVHDGSVKLLRSSAGSWSRRCLGWSDVVKGGVEIFDIPGTHEHVLLEPTEALVASYLDIWLREVEPRNEEAPT